MTQLTTHPGLPESARAAVGFAACAHRKQKRKYTGEPYVNHCQSVAFIAYQYTGDLDVILAAILHDTVEDTDVTADYIREVFGERATRLVLEVTDPAVEGNRDFRKRLAREHVANSSPEGAAIKLADLIDNSRSILDRDPEFAKVYLEEKRLLMQHMGDADPTLLAMATAIVEAA